MGKERLRQRSDFFALILSVCPSLPIHRGGDQPKGADQIYQGMCQHQKHARILAHANQACVPPGSTDDTGWAELSELIASWTAQTVMQDARMSLNVNVQLSRDTRLTACPCNCMHTERLTGHQHHSDNLIPSTRCFGPLCKCESRWPDCCSIRMGLPVTPLFCFLLPFLFTVGFPAQF